MPLQRRVEWLRAKARTAVRVTRREGIGGLAFHTRRVTRRALAERPVPRPSSVTSAVTSAVRRTPVAASTVATASGVIDAIHATLPDEPSTPAATSPPALVPAPAPAVAVVVPAFDAAEHLRGCLDSVLAQTHRRWRCYVVDDASGDETAAIVEEYARADERFVVLRHGRNGGLSAARNTGLLEADEPFVTFLDAEDLLVPRSLERRLAAALERDDPAVAGAWGSTPLVPEETTLADARSMDVVQAGWTVHAVSAGGECPFNAHAPLLRTELLRRLGGFDERLRQGAEDWDLWHRLLRHGYVIVGSGGRAGLYRQRPGSMARRDQRAHVAVADGLLRSAYAPAIVDPDLLADPAAAHPLSVLEMAVAQARRIALSTGIQIGATGTFAVDRSLVELCGPLTAAQLDELDLVETIVAGLHRGLGLGTARDDLSPATAAKVEAIATAAAGRLHAALADRSIAAPDPAAGEGVDVRPVLSRPTLLVAAETAADVAPLAAVVDEAAGRAWEVAALDLDVTKGDEGASRAWDREGTPLVPFNHLALGRVRPSVFLVRRPFGPVTADTAEALRAAGTTVVELPTPDRPTRVECNPSEARELDGEWPVEPPVAEVGAPEGLRGFARHFAREEPAGDPTSVPLLRDLHDRHVGETCVIVGNGPSLNETDLSVLAGVPTFAVNGIFYAQERFPDPISYYVVEDTSVFRENTEEIKAFTAGHKLFPSMYRPSFGPGEIDDHTGFFRMNAGFYGRDTGTECHPRFSVDATQRVFCGQSVTIINLQLAYWMGFSRVVLIGMDFSYVIPDDVDRDGDVLTSNSDDVNHFHKDYFGKGKTWKDPKLDRVLVNYALAGEMFAADGREIVNATVGGNLHLFRRMTLAEAVGAS